MNQGEAAAAIIRRDVRIALPVSESFPEPVHMAATLFAPAAASSGAPVLFLFPGGAHSRLYFDLHLSGRAGYSQAEYHAARGVIVIAMDHLGAGESSLPPDSDLATPVSEPGVSRFSKPSPFTLDVMGAACAAGARAALEGLRAGTLDPALPALEPGCVIGAGHSMGGHVVVIAQANHAPFDAIAVLGASVTQTRFPLRPGARYPIRNAPLEAQLAAFSDGDMLAAFHWPDEPADVLGADRTDATTPQPWRSKAVPRCAGRLLLPHAVAREAAAVRAPVFLAYGQMDVTPEPLADVAMFRSSCDIRLSIIPRMAHLHNFADTRAELWRRLGDYIREAPSLI